MAKQNISTREGLKKLEEELAWRKGQERNRIKEAIAVAKSFGDLSENSEYDEAREQQAKNEHAINELEELIKNTIVIEESETATDKVTLDKTIKVRNEKTGKEHVYHIVGSTDANPFENKISNLSPLGIAFMGSKVGDKVTATSPNGAIDFTILEINKKSEG